MQKPKANLGFLVLTLILFSSLLSPNLIRIAVSDDVNHFHASVKVGKSFYFAGQNASLIVTSNSSAYQYQLVVTNPSSSVVLNQTVTPNATVQYTVPAVYGLYTVTCNGTAAWFWAQDVSNLTSLSLPYTFSWKNVNYTLSIGYILTASASDGGSITVDWLTTLFGYLPSRTVVVTSNPSAIRLRVTSGSSVVDVWYFKQFRGLVFRANGTISAAVTLVWNITGVNPKWRANTMSSGGSLTYDWGDLSSQSYSFIVLRTSSQIYVNVPTSFDFYDQLFSDGFETGDFSAWTGSVTATSTISSTIVYNGLYSMKLSAALSGGGDNVRYKTIATPPATIYIRAYVYIANYSVFTADGDYDNLVGFQSNVAGNMVSNAEIGRTSSATYWAIKYRASTVWTWAFSVGTVTANGWYCLELKHVTSTGANLDGEEHLYVDGVNVVDVTGISNNDRTLSDGYAGSDYYHASSTTVTYYYDDVVVSNAYIGTEPFGGNEYDYVTHTSDIDSSANVGTHSNFTAQQYSDLINDTLTEANFGATSTVFTDGFEDGTFTKWTDGGATSWGDGATFMATNSSPGSPWVTHSGTYMADCDSNDDGNLISDNIDASGKYNIGVSFWHMDDDMDGDDFYFYAYNGTTYNSIVALSAGGTGSEDVWIYYSWVTTDSQYLKSTFRVCFGATPASGEGAFIDDVAINTTAINYRLDIEEQWINANYTRGNRELDIYMGAFSTAETIYIQWWNSTASSWLNMTGFTSLTASAWNNASVTTYLTSATFTIRFLDGTAVGDTVQSTWAKDCAVLHTWDSVSAAPPTNDACGTTAAFDAGVDAWVNMTVSDVNLVADLSTVDIQVTASDGRNFCLRWTQSSNTFSEVNDTSGICTLSGSSVRANLNTTQDLVSFCFQISSDAQSGNCNVAAVSTDDESTTDTDLYASKFSINFYFSITVTDSTFSWTGLVPGSTNVTINGGDGSDGFINFTVTANHAFNIQAEGDGALTYGSYTIPLANVLIHATALGSAAGLTTGYVNVGGLTGLSMGANLAEALILWLTVPNPQQDGSYTFTLSIQGVST